MWLKKNSISTVLEVAPPVYKSLDLQPVCLSTPAQLEGLLLLAGLGS